MSLQLELGFSLAGIMIHRLARASISLAIIICAIILQKEHLSQPYPDSGTGGVTLNVEAVSLWKPLLNILTPHCLLEVLEVLCWPHAILSNHVVPVNPG